MSISLVYSRNRNNDSPVRFTDVQLFDTSIMVDILSFHSEFRRSAGWIYPIRPATDIDYERGPGTLLLFGKTRLDFSSFSDRYFLEFFPRYGIKAFVLSVYTGIPDPEADRKFVQFGDAGFYFRLNSDTNELLIREGGVGSLIYAWDSPVFDAYIFETNLWYRTTTGMFWSLASSNLQQTERTSEEYFLKRFDPAAIELT